MNKYSQYLLYFALAISVTVILNSCDADIAETTQELNEIETFDIDNEIGIDELKENNKMFSQIFDISNDAEKKNGVTALGIKVNSNDEQLVEIFNDNNITFRYNSGDVDSYLDSQENSDSAKTPDKSESNIGKDVKFVQIEILGVATLPSYNEDDYSGYTLEFSDEIKDKLEKENILTVFDLVPTVDNSSKKWNYRYLYGDAVGVNASTGTQAYYYYSNCADPYSCYNPPIYYHSYKYFSASWPYPYGRDFVTVCCLYNCLGKSMKRIYYTSGYILNIGFYPNRCLTIGCNTSCYYG